MAVKIFSTVQVPPGISYEKTKARSLLVCFSVLPSAVIAYHQIRFPVSPKYPLISQLSKSPLQSSVINIQGVSSPQSKWLRVAIPFLLKLKSFKRKKVDLIPILFYNMLSTSRDTVRMNTSFYREFALWKEAQNKYKQLIADLEARADSLNTSLRRAKRDGEFLSKKLRTTSTEVTTQLRRKMAKELLQILDALDRAIPTFERPSKTHQKLEPALTGLHTNLQLISSELVETLGLIPIIPNIGDPFDLKRHTALETRQAPHPNGTILEIIRKGYTLDQVVLRPAEVITAIQAEVSSAAVPPLSPLRKFFKVIQRFTTRKHKRT